jgi:hypothetical protein
MPSRPASTAVAGRGCLTRIRVWPSFLESSIARYSTLLRLQMCPTKELLRCEIPSELDTSSLAGADGPSLATRKSKHRASWPTTHASSTSSDRMLPLSNSRPCLSKFTRHLAIFRRRTLCSSSSGALRPKATTRITTGSTCLIFRPTT